MSDLQMVYCDVCGNRIWRKKYMLENKTWCHACLEERAESIVLENKDTNYTKDKEDKKSKKKKNKREVGE